MSWAVGFDSTWRRDIGYGVPAFCDHPKCSTVIDRGLGYVCHSQKAYGGDGCGLYFCERHADALGRCARCRHRRGSPYAAKPDHPKWITHKLTDPSWAEWRDAHVDDVVAMRATL